MFLGLGEKLCGEIDAIYSPAKPGIYNDDDYTYYSSKGMFINYT